VERLQLGQLLPELPISEKSVQHPL
jgi:hypothetical protein